MALRRLAPILVALCLALVACAAPATSPSASEPDAPDPTPSASPTATASATPSAAAYPLTVTDDAGREVTIEAEPQRIVSLAPSNTEIVCALDACDRLVGVTDFDDFPPEVAEIEKVVVTAVVDVELVVDAAPDLVIAAGNEITPSTVITQLEELGLTVLVLYPQTLEEIYGDIELVGEVLGRADVATDLVAEMEAGVAEVTAAVEGADRPVTMYEVFYSEGTTYTAGEGSFLASMIELAGGEPVTGDAQGLVAPEALVSANPEVILLGTASYDPSLADPATALETVADRPGWAELAAVQDERVVPFMDDIVTTRPGPRVVEGLEALARAIHPDRFEDAP